MSSFITIGGGNRTARANNIDPPSEFNFIGSGVSIVRNNTTGQYDITISGGSSGEANTSSSSGVDGISIVLPKSGVNLPFKALNIGSGKMSITDDTTDHTVDFDVVESALNIANMIGSIGDSRITDLAYSKLTSVPTTIVQTNIANTYSAGLDQIFQNQSLKLHSGTGIANTIFKTLVSATDRTITFPDITSTVVMQTSLDTFSANQKKFSDDILAILNPASTFTYNVRSSAITASRDITIPLLTANDQFTFDNFATTLTNKIFDKVELANNTTPANPPTGSSRVYTKTVDTNNDGVFALVKKNGSFVEVQLA